MKPKEKTYKFKLYEEDLSNELLIRKIRKAISTLPVAYFSFIIVDLFKEDTKPGIQFFQTTRHREFKKTQYYTVEIRVDSQTNGQLIWIIYRKDMQTKEQVLQIFEEICVKRKFPTLFDWKKTDICSQNDNSEGKNLYLTKRTITEYLSNASPTPTEKIIYLESLRYYINYCKNYIADKWVSLAEQYCKNGQYKKAKEIYESITFAPDATYNLANMIMSGKLGKPNYKLAYEYYKHSCLIDDINYFGAKIAIAKMHRDGKYFKPNYEIYKKIIKSVESESLNESLSIPFNDDLYYELALIEQTDGNIEQAITYCLEARHWIEEFLTYGNEEKHILNAIKIFKLLYTLTEFDIASTNAFDLLYLLKTPLRVVFIYEKKPYVIESFYDKGYLIIKLNEEFYSGAVNFFLNATLDGHRISHEADKITIIEVQK